ncbi:polysaccharide deacetylase family protein [Guptibacillus hwajinpoensis]|uniref:Peptidoglycan/xylan/chitin deacetylase (PgdA/CDA1 family) n=1 Tax=Guptibacillus hwajinpoensis TaxID=208199 RepID=A0ABU0K269_9BACL|nr:polysaccharide deacetylase family protein [Alkalihalobacillus hemicentroti]MDQ0482576.1 peptidoglycan/xylan/chitin deacetylase (PgdA/CDA1 family) [Alkalihalobacillus hemicentroti]
MKKIYLFGLLILAIVGSLVGFGFNEDGDYGTKYLSQKESSGTVNAADSDEEQNNVTETNELESQLREQQLAEAAKIAPAKEVPVLTYHHIVAEDDLRDRHYKEDGSLVNSVVILEEFKKQMKWLHEHEYLTLTLDEFQQYIEGQIPLPKNSVLLTFDDGHKNNYIEAYPVMKQYGFTAVQFLITSLIDDETVPYTSEYNQYLSVEEIEETSDVFEFASHTNTFHNSEEDGTAYLISKTLPEIQEDVLASITIIGNTNALAYPYGAYDDETMEALEAIGVDMAFTVQGGNVQPGDDMLQIHRNSVRPHHSIDDFEEIVSVR